MSRIKTKFLEDNAVNDVKLRLRNNQALRARNAGNTADVETLKVSTSDILTILREMSMDSHKITNLADPTNAQDAVTKNYVDAVISGLSDPKDAARVATIAPLAAATYDNGTNGVGATLTANANGALPSIDGVGLSLNDRILVKDQAAGLQNGIYVLSQLGDAGSPWILTRSLDANEGSAHAGPADPNLVSQGMLVPVAQGSTNGALGYILTTVDPISLGVTALGFTQFGEVVQAGQGIVKTGTTLSVDEGAGLGFTGNQLVVQVDDDLVDGTTKIASDEVVGRRRFEESFTLSAGDITNGYVDLTKVASRDSIGFFPRFGIKQKETVDFTVSYQGGTGGKTRVTWTGDFGSIVEAGDVLDINFESLDY